MVFFGEQTMALYLQSTKISILICNKPNDIRYCGRVAADRCQLFVQTNLPNAVFFGKLRCFEVPTFVEFSEIDPKLHESAKPIARDDHGTNCRRPATARPVGNLTV